MRNVSPHNAHRWVKCPGCFAEAGRLPHRTPSLRRDEGVAAHKLFSRALLGEDISTLVDKTDTATKVFITGEMVNAVKQAAGIVCDTQDRLGGEVWIEHRINLDCIYPGMSGIIDAAVVSSDEIHIYDYKHGKIPVEVRENWQMVCYAVGMMENPEYHRHRVYLHILQPHSWGDIDAQWEIPRTDSDLWSYPAEEFLSDRALMLKSRAAETFEEKPALHVGRHCVACAALYGCREAAECDIGALCHLDGGWSQPPTDDQLSRELIIIQDAEEILARRRAAIEEYGLTRIEETGFFPRFVIDTGRGSIVWREPPERLEIAFPGICKGKEYITPIQAKKLKIPEATLKLYSRHLPGKPRLIRAEEYVEQLKKLMEENDG